MYILNNLPFLFVLLSGLFSTHVCEGKSVAMDVTTNLTDPCIPLRSCSYFAEVLDHPSLIWQQIQQELKKHDCGFDENNGDRKGKVLFQKDIITNKLKP